MADLLLDFAIDNGARQRFDATFLNTPLSRGVSFFLVFVLLETPQHRVDKALPVTRLRVRGFRRLTQLCPSHRNVKRIPLIIAVISC